MKLAKPALQIFISDKNWPNMEVLIVTDTGREYNAQSMYDIAGTQLIVPVMNAFSENLRAEIDLRKAKEKRK